MSAFGDTFWKVSTFYVTMVLSLSKLTTQRARSTRCGFSWLMSLLLGPHAKIQVWLSPFRGTQVLCFISGSREGWKHLLSSPKEDGVSFSSGWLRAPEVSSITWRQGWNQREKTSLLPLPQKITLSSIHLTTTIKSWDAKRCIKCMPFPHHFLSSLRNTTSFLLYFSLFEGHLSPSGGGQSRIRHTAPFLPVMKGAYDRAYVFWIIQNIRKGWLHPMAACWNCP